MTEPTTRRRTWRSVVGSVVTTVLFAALLLLVWPPQLGGHGAMSIVTGRSMEPTYVTGDLIYAWHGPVQHGDIVVYSPDPGLGRIVHRVVGGNAHDGWVMQGDNNSWIDPYKPTDEDILGVVRVHVPGVGKIAGLVTNPAIPISCILLGIGLMLWPTKPDDDPIAPPTHEPTDETA